MVDSSQKDIFLSCEGDKWFERNFNALNNNQVPRQIEFFGKFIKKSYKILEIGCAYGRFLDYYRKIQPCEVYGVDPSERAIIKGRELYSGINLNVGTSEKLDFPDGFFDYVIFGFCLYLVDRKYLLQSISEADRVLKSKGYLGIIDFDAKIPKKRLYKHCEGIYSYKMDYSGIFLSVPHYNLAEKIAISSSSNNFTEIVGDRIMASVLFKDFDTYILEPDV